MKKMIGLYCIVFVLLICSLGVQAGPALDIVQAKINKAVSVLRNPEPASDKNKIIKKDKIAPIINAIFDYAELSKMVLGRNWKRLSSSQQAEFIGLFKKLLMNVYLDRILAYTDEKIRFTKENFLSDDKVEIQSEIITQTKTIPVYYRMIIKNKKWKIYEVIIEGVSLVHNYRSQFRNVLRKKTPQELIEMLKRKVA